MKTLEYDYTQIFFGLRLPEEKEENEEAEVEGNIIFQKNMSNDN